MTRKIIYLMFPLLLLIFVPFVNAENATTTSAKTATDATTKLNQQMQLMQEQKNNATNGAKTIIQIMRDRFQANILKIKDQNKKRLVEKIDAKIAEINTNQTARFSKVLATIQGFLDKIKQSTTDTGVLEEIASAQSGIDLAKEAVKVQAAKTYTMDVTDDLTLKANAGVIISQFRHDITLVYRFIVDVKQKVQKLNIDRNMIKNEATSSANL